jgi:membrane protein YqaA with SNARE-associated domain
VNIGDYSTPLLMFASTVAICFASAIIPLVNMELFVIFLGSVAPPPLLPALLIVGTLSHMLGKSVMYAAGRAFDKLPPGALKRRVAAAREKVQDRPNLGAAVILTSAFTGLPPFYAVTVLSGVVRYNFLWFFVAGFGGRLLRFGALILLPQLGRS